MYRRINVPGFILFPPGTLQHTNIPTYRDLVFSLQRDCNIPMYQRTGIYYFLSRDTATYQCTNVPGFIVFSTRTLQCTEVPTYRDLLFSPRQRNIATYRKIKYPK